MSADALRWFDGFRSRSGEEARTMRGRPAPPGVARLVRVVVAVFAALAASALTGVTAAAESPFVAIDLGAGTAHAYFINDAGQVAGTGGSGAFLWTEAGGPVSLGDLGGTPTLAGINESGQIVGRIWFSSGQYDAFSWTQAGGVVDIGATLGYSAAMGVNDAGQVAGWMLSYPSHRAFIWTRTGGLVPLGALNNG